MEHFYDKFGDLSCIGFEQCDFRFDLFFSFSFRFKNIF